MTPISDLRAFKGCTITVRMIRSDGTVRTRTGRLVLVGWKAIFIEYEKSERKYRIPLECILGLEVIA
ncbi:MAG TPA: hypothetical protein VKU79_06555 [Thermoplasmataceae archaeon]|nr:hypothetical protein [Thermoplasmataceae archaeon]